MPRGTSGHRVVPLTQFPFGGWGATAPFPRSGGWLAATLAGLVLASACGDPVHPLPLVIESQGLASDTVLVGTPGRGTRVALWVVDLKGDPVAGAAVRWSVVGSQARVDSASPFTAADGAVTAFWVMGTRASEAQELDVGVTGGSRSASERLHAVLVPSEVASLDVTPASLTVRLGVRTALQVRAVDPYGNTVAQPRFAFSSLDPARLGVDSLGRVTGHSRGVGRVLVQSQAVTDTVAVQVEQVVQSIRVAADTLRFSALGAVREDSVALLDDVGQLVADSLPFASVADSTVATATLTGVLAVRSCGNGVTTVTLGAGPTQRLVTVMVGQRVTGLSVTPDSSTLRLGLADTLRVAATDSLGSAVAQPGTAFASLDTAVVAVDSGGIVRGRSRGWGRVAVRAQGAGDTVRVHVVQVVQAIRVSADTLRFTALGAVQTLDVGLVDDQGLPVADSAPSAGVTDTAVAALVSPGALSLRSRRNGATTLQLAAGDVQRSVVAIVAQRATRLALARDTLRFDALAESLEVAATAYDSLGSVVAGGIGGLVVDDTTVAAVLGDSALRARQNGTTAARFTLLGLSGSVPVVVAQVAASVAANLTSTNRILMLATGAAVPITCQGLDRNGFALAAAPTVVTSGSGVVAGASCATLRAQHSGLDTIRVSLGAASTTVPLAVALPAVVWPPQAESLWVDSFPTIFTDSGPVPASSVKPFAISLRRNSRGQTELYVSLNVTGVSQAFEDLHRYVSDDNAHFRYDGLVLRHDTLTTCGLLSYGIEQIAIVPRSDGPGWRMYFAGGNFNCYGWQVFSAVSTDERKWTIENGVRLDNGGSYPPAPPVRQQWPVGEGMVVDQAPNGEWRMIVGGYQRVTPVENKFQLVEWRSTDQLNWRYVGPVLTTAQMPPEADASIYSPSIVEFAPGLWRMVFTGDNRADPNGRYRTWSAVSTDRGTWQVEGILMGQTSGNFSYVAVLGNLLVTVVPLPVAAGSGHKLAVASITMP